MREIASDQKEKLNGIDAECRWVSITIAGDFSHPNLILTMRSHSPPSATQL